MSPALTANLEAFALGALGAVGLFFLLFIAKVYRETIGSSVDQRVGKTVLAIVAAISLAITLTPLWLAAGIFGVIVIHLARYLRGLF